jgi:general secretion pathway protein J
MSAGSIPGQARVAGFTLLELLLALAMLATGVLIALATVRGAGAVSLRGQLQARQQEQQRITANLLRRQLQRAQPVAFALDPQTRRPLAFTGGPQEMRFVAQMPGYLGGRAQVHHWGIATDAHGTQLNLTLWPLQPGQGSRAATSAEVVAWPLAQARFRYRGRDPRTGRPGPWLDRWTDPSRLPHLVALEAVGVDGRPWPMLWIAPHRAGAVAEARR